MLAVHDDSGDVGYGHAFVEEKPAWLWLTSGPSKHGDIVGAAIGDLTRERKGGVVGSDEYVVTAIIQQLHGIARAVYQSYELAANAVAWLRTNDLNCADAARGGSRAIDDSAGLPRVGRLSKNGHGVGGSAREEGRESKINAPRAADGEIVTTVVL